ncbi:hypothetical protein Peur_052196 [Populus x canadensis]
MECQSASLEDSTYMFHRAILWLSTSIKLQQNSKYLDSRYGDKDMSTCCRSSAP